MLNTRDIKNLYRMFDETDIGEVEIHSEGMKIRLEFGEKTVTKSALAEIQVQSKTAVDTVKGDNSLPPNFFELRSKWVGFFTRLNPKTGEYYIKLRDTVKKGEIIAHVRVLGVMQDVKAEADGKLKEILVEDGQPIEYGQPIMRFEK